MSPTRSRFDRIQCDGIRRSRGLRRFVEKRLEGWILSQGLNPDDPSLDYLVRFQRQVPGHQIVCQIHVKAADRSWTDIRIAANPFLALDECLAHLILRSPPSGRWGAQRPGVGRLEAAVPA